jgi:hypothetical protein
VEKRSKKLFEMGFDETPSIVINGRLVSRSVGNMSLECIIKLLKIEIEKSGGQGDSEEDVAPW